MYLAYETITIYEPFSRMLFPWMLQMKNDLKATLDLLFRVRFLGQQI